MPASDILKDDLLDDALDQLDDERSLGIALLAFARTVIDRPENNRKIDNSYSGHAMDLLTKLALRELRMWCSRVWDIPTKGSPVHSLPMVSSRLEGRHVEICDARRRTHPDWPEESLGKEDLASRLSEFMTSVRDTQDSNLLNQLRLVRNEHFAHLVKGHSRFRSKLSASAAKSDYTWDDVLKLVEKSISLIEDAILIWRSHLLEFEGTLSIISSYYEKFWKYLPNLSEIEEQERLEKIRKKQSQREGGG